MSELTPLSILIAARAKIADPSNWGKGMRSGGQRGFETCCAAEAVEESITGDDYIVRKHALLALSNAAGLDWKGGRLTEWNDAPERTHAEVLAAYNLAIATLRLS